MSPLYISENSIKEQEHYSKLVEKTISGKGLTYFIETYGCQMNVRDSETIAGFLHSMGFTETFEKDSANLLFFNTCCVRDHAEKKLMANIGALKDRKESDPSMIICIGGCMMQEPNMAKKTMDRFKFLDAVLGTNSFWKLPEVIWRIISGERVLETEEYQYAICEHMPAVRAPGASAFVNIMFGCDNYCSYCIVPYVRGRERSRSPQDILAEIRELVSKGYSEITLLGQNVNSYGRGTDCTFPNLLRLVNKEEGIKRIRFMTSHPKDLSDELISAIRDCENVCHHIHLPLQSGSNRVLKEMNRRYDTARYCDLISKLRSEIPDIEITTDVIVGFPGETEDDFNDTLELVRGVGFSSAFTFKYSPRIGTRAATMNNQIPEETKKERLARLNQLQAEMTKISNRRYLDKVDTVLVDGADFKNGTILHGRLGNFKMVYFNGTHELINSYCTVKITECNNNSLLGEIV